MLNPNNHRESIVISLENGNPAEFLPNKDWQNSAELQQLVAAKSCVGGKNAVQKQQLLLNNRMKTDSSNVIIV